MNRVNKLSNKHSKNLFNITVNSYSQLIDSNTILKKKIETIETLFYDSSIKFKSFRQQKQHYKYNKNPNMEFYYKVQIRTFSKLLKLLILYKEELINTSLEEQNINLNTPSKEIKSIISYRNKCRFKLKLEELQYIKGYSLLEKYGWYNRETNPTGVVKDHRISVKFGYDNNLDPYLLSNSANCEFLTFTDNLKKSSKCSISYEELLLEISKIKLNL